MSARRGDWMQTATGRQFWPLDPRPSEVYIEDIAHSLAHQCRYAGHCLSFYSAAQHSVIVSDALPPEFALWGLLHDASEAYLVDVPRPVKPFLPGYKDAEAAVMRAVCVRFGLTLEMPKTVKVADERALADEKHQLMAPSVVPWALRYPPLGVRIDPLPPEAAKALFLARFRELAPKEPVGASPREG
ncbi:phosphohydrolase (plasmid) [Azospirillum brasilense]|uniref:Phosphohydrolase n=1 Tax=Azospirillum brasilense TaxID=192 RepID=A0A4D8RA16_AZOBR|nr:phosphohydrolase [Azospirillum brasilense]QCO18881.1 phosphohydrolase [Azospirillum brasilense]